jgi:KDO2-lipid IV(A) lauroyltransferase
MTVPPKKRKKKKKKAGPVLNWIGYALMRVGLFILFLFPVRSNLKFACFLGNLMWKHYKRGRIRAMDNLRASFPEKSQAELEEIGRKSFQHIVMLTIDIFYSPRLVQRDNWKQYSDLIGIERAKWLMQEGRGLLMVTGHYGNFEIVGYMLGLFGFNIYSIARPLDNPYINKYLYGIREKRGQKIIDKKGASEHMEELAKNHATLCFIGDQDAGRKGVFVDFFGRKASAYKSIGLMALHYNMPIAVGGCRQRHGEFFFEIECSRIIMPEEWADKDQPLQWVTQEYTTAMEEFIRKDPTQYWWLHRRWKSRPKEERKAMKEVAAVDFLSVQIFLLAFQGESVIGHFIDERFAAKIVNMCCRGQFLRQFTCFSGDDIDIQCRQCCVVLGFPSDSVVVASCQCRAEYRC